MASEIFRAHRAPALILCFAVFFAFGLTAQEEPDKAFADELDVQADSLEFNENTGQIVGRGNVEATYRGIRLFADSVEVNAQSGAVVAVGKVKLERDDSVWTGDEIRGNFQTGVFDVDDYNATSGPWYLRGEGASRDANGRVAVRRAQVSTCEDYRAWRMEARRLRYDPSTGSFRAWNVVYKVAGVPVFYFPYAQGSKDVEYQGFSIQPGYRSEWGPYFRIGRRFRLTDAIGADLGVNWLAQRGFLLDGALNRDTDWTSLNVSGAWLRDSEPPTDGVVGGKDVNRRFYAEEDRYRLRLDHRAELTDDLVWRGQLDHRSDPDYLWEFHRSEFRDAPEPPSFANLSLSRPEFAASVTARARVNDFETVVERLPEIRFDVPRQPLGKTPLLYQSQNSFANLRLATREYDLSEPADLDPYSTVRADSTHFLFLPLSRSNIQFTPRLGGGVTWYEQSSSTGVSDAELAANMAADDAQSLPGSGLATFGYDNLGEEQARWFWEAGFEVSTKFHRTWQDWSSEFLDANGLRHVLRPYLNYTYRDEPNVDRENLFYFDETDRLRGANFARIGLEQRFQTRRENRIETFARVNVFYDQHLDVPDSSEGDEEAGEFGAVVEVRPTSKVRVYAAALAGVGEGDLSVADVGLEVSLDNGVDLSIAYLFRDDYRSQPGYSMASTFERVHDSYRYPVYHLKSHNVRTAVAIPVTARDEFRMRHYFDIEDSRLARHRYEWLREFDCWVGSLGFEYESEDYAVFLSLYLKAFPGARVSAGL